MVTSSKLRNATVAAVLALAMGAPAALAAETPAGSADPAGGLEAEPAAVVDVSEGVDPLEEWAPTADEIAEMTADQDALAAYLDGEGISYTRIDEDGISWVEWDYNDETANAAVAAYYEDLYGDMFDEGDFDEGDLHEE